ncbi:MAG: heme-binding protein [Colwellia sp.]
MLKKLYSFVFLFVISSQSFSTENVVVLDFDKAQEIQNSCIKYAKDNNLKIAIAIYDVHGNLKSFARMDGSSVGSSELAQWKGKSAAIYQYPTSESAKWNIPTAPHISIATGGIPIKSKSGITIGGIGVSGAQASIDVACAEAGL